MTEQRTVSKEHVRSERTSEVIEDQRDDLNRHHRGVPIYARS